MKLNKTLALAALALVLGLAPRVCLAQKRGPSTPEEREQTVRLTRALETDPFNKEAKNARAWLIVFLTEVPDISVTVSSCYLEPIFSKDKNYGSDLFFQSTFASAAFMIEHPDQAKDEVAVNKAGIEGSLRMYEAILKQKPKAKWPFLDELIARREKGTLEDYVREAAAKCKAKS